MKVTVEYFETVPKQERFANWKVGLKIEYEADVFDDIPDLQAQTRYLVLMEKIRVMRSEGEDVDTVIELAQRVKPKESGILRRMIRAAVGS